MSLLDQGWTSLNMATTKNGTRDVIIYDSGCSRPSFNDLKWFIDLDRSKKDTMSGIGGDAVVEGFGTVQFKFPDPLDPTELLKWTEPGVAYIPTAPVNLLSANALESRDIHYCQKS